MAAADAVARELAALGVARVDLGNPPAPARRVLARFLAANLEVLGDGEVGEDAAVLRNPAEPEPRDALRREPVDPRAAKKDVAASSVRFAWPVVAVVSTLTISLRRGDELRCEFNSQRVFA
jgi:hypothetical protein